jgi:tRNA A37 threonylcarbamoyladenosine dehydratase
LSDILEKIETDDFYSRTKMLLGSEKLLKLINAKVAVCGLGGVGSAAAEALARGGIGFLRLIDFDKIAKSNLNRQLHTTLDNIGCLKAEALQKRLENINENCSFYVVNQKITADNLDSLLSGVDYIVDAIDDVPAKIALAVWSKTKGIPIVSAMGTGNKIHPELLEIADISKTQVCPLARKMRRELKKHGIEKGLWVVYSQEIPQRAENETNTPASISFVPPAAGMILAGKVIRDLAGLE